MASPETVQSVAHLPDPNSCPGAEILVNDEDTTYRSRGGAWHKIVDKGQADTLYAGGGGDVTSYNAATNNSGNTTIAPAAGKTRHAEKITLGGTERTSVGILSTSNRQAGDEIEVTLLPPDVAAIVFQFRNATSGGTVLYTHETDGSEETNGYRLVARFRYTGTAWEFVTATYMAP